MGFLAVPDLEQTAKALGLIDLIFAALSSIIVGVYFVWRHNRPPPSKNTLHHFQTFIYIVLNNRNLS